MQINAREVAVTVRLHRFLIGVGVQALLACEGTGARPEMNFRSQPATDLQYLLTWKDPFSRIDGFIQLDSQRVAIADSRERRVTIADLKTRQARSVDGTGRGPGEFLVPGKLLPVNGKVFLIEDRFSGRLVSWSTTGGEVNVLNVPPELAGATLEGADSLGHLYLHGRSTRFFRSAQAETTDSVFVLRWPIINATIDTLFRVRYPAVVPTTRTETDRGNTAIMNIEVVQPFSPQDAWLARQDGSIVVARVEPFRIEIWRSADRSVQGRILEYELVRVSRGEVDHYRDAGIDVDLPAYKPPFPAGGLVPPGYPDIWLELSAPIDAGYRPYLILDDAGVPAGRVNMPADRRIIWAHGRSIFAVRVDHDDLKWLELYRLPVLQ
jgi:hypothetical protein